MKTAAKLIRAAHAPVNLHWRAVPPLGSRRACHWLKPGLQAVALVLASFGLMLLGALAQPAPRPAALLPHHYVFVIDTSFSMNRVAPATRAALRELIADGVQQRMRSGDRFELWSLDDQVHTRRYPAQTWTAESSQELAARAFAFISRQRFEKQARPKAALAELNRVAEQVPTLTAIILTDGDDPMRGTPFDPGLNTVLRRRHGQLRQARQPFLVALQASDGQFDAWAVGAPNEPIMLPQLELAAQPARAQPAGAPAQPQPPQPAELKAPPPQPPPQPSTPLAPAPAQAVTERPPAREELPAPAKVAPAAPTEPVVAAAAQAAPAKTELVPPPPPKPEPPSELAPPPSAAPGSGARLVVPPPPDKADRTKPVVGAATLQKPAATNAGPARPKARKPPPQPTGLITPEPASPQRWLDLGLGAGLLALGCWFAYWYVRRTRPARPLSLISQSLERREGKPGQRT